MKVFNRRFIRNVGIINMLVGLLGVIIIFLAVVVFQKFYSETNCASCSLQRAAMLGVGLSLLMNLRYGNRVSHWSSAILTACAGISVSVYQILLHINTTHGYGRAMMGYHIYTWAFIFFAAVIVGSALMLLLYPEQLR